MFVYMGQVVLGTDENLKNIKSYVETSKIYKK